MQFIYLLTYFGNCFQGALVGLCAGLVVAFWLGIGSILTRSTRPLPVECGANATIAIQTAFNNTTLRYGSLRLHTVTSPH